MADSMRSSTVGLIGLGKMGGGMARNILAAGHGLVVYDIDPEKCKQLAELGAEAAEGPSRVAERSRVVITMVDTTQQTQDVTIGRGGVIDGARPGDIVICMSTVDAMAVRGIQGALAERGIDIIDSPVSGMIKGAQDGTLRAFVGGDQSVLETCRPVLEAMTSEIIHVGPLGSGLAMKLVNNMMYKVNSIAAIEGMVLGVKAGLDPNVILDVIGRSTGNSPAFQYRAKRMIERDFEGVRLDISYKDLELETALGSSLHVPLFLPNVCKQIFEMGRAAGLGGKDATALVTIYEQLAGVTIGDPEK
ncbi:NAD(P)-dependent oxidoreductase [Streptomyces sp. NPDC001027]|uniref:NAD(P)-dependent oxidoreductase n=1 Tax=Streptomyces sp. NPDC001027 TaxID=3154771 RepID=UPI0033274C6F